MSEERSDRIEKAIESLTQEVADTTITVTLRLQSVLKARRPAQPEPDHILIKTISLENYLDLMLELKTESKILELGVTTAKMVKKTSDLGVNYAIEFSLSPIQPERFQELSQFISTLSAPVYARLKDAEEEIPATTPLSAVDLSTPLLEKKKTTK